VKAIVQDRNGSAEVLRMADIDRPVPDDDEVLVRVHAAGLDPGVWHLLTGLPYLMRSTGHGLRKPAIRVLGRDIAGRVEEVGRRVTHFQRDDLVFGICEGSFAEYACVRPEKLAIKPANLTYVQAAAVPTSALTALHGLRDWGGIRAGQHVLIIGAAGGVGTFAVQLAKAYGAIVTGVCSTAKVELVRSIGADDVIDYLHEDFAEGSRDYELILDTAGNRSLSRLRRVLTARGTLVITGGESGGHWSAGMDRRLRALMLSPFVGQKLLGFRMVESSEDLVVVRDFIEAGKVVPIIDTTYPLSETAEAISHARQAHASGKVVITI